MALIARYTAPLQKRRACVASRLRTRDELTVRPRNDPRLALAGVFCTRSPDRPNPIGLHRVRVVSLAADQIEVEPLEAVDETPIVDLKPVWKSAGH